ncbi:unnamed protein product [Phaeothamnion confervicola]
MWVEWLILGDAAEVVNNKLYLMGGGWDRLMVHTAFPVAQHFGVALSVVVTPEETNKPHEFALDVLSPEGKLLATIEAEFEVGRASDTTPRNQRWQFATSIDLSLESAGSYPVVINLNGIEAARQVFEVSVAPPDPVE